MADTAALGFLKGTPVLVGLGVVAVTAFLYIFTRSKSRPKALIDPTVKYPLKLVEKTTVSHDTFIFRFELPTPGHILGLPTGQHVHLSATINGQMVVRKYTPVSSDDDLGVMDLVVKVYFKDVHPKFPEGGKLTQYLNDMPIGGTIDVRGPAGRLVYKGNGEFAISPEKSKPPNIFNVKKVNMIAGGSGITPMLQIIKAVFKEDNDIQLALVFANQTEEDILCRADLEKVQKEHPNRFKLWYTLDRPAKDWKYSTGFINDTILKDVFHPPSNDTITLMCGPPPMINFACNPALEKLGYDPKRSFAY